MKARPEWPKATAVVANPSRRKAGAAAVVAAKNQNRRRLENCRRLMRTPKVVALEPLVRKSKNPALPMPATLDADPVLFPPDTRQLNYGDPKSKSTTASSGSGTGNGIR